MFVAVCVAGIVLIACMMLALTACVLNKYKAQKKKDWLELHGHSGGDGGDGGGVRFPTVLLSSACLHSHPQRCLLPQLTSRSRDLCG